LSSKQIILVRLLEIAAKNSQIMMLLFLVTAPALGASLIFFIEKSKKDFILNFSLFLSLAVFNCSLYLMLLFDPTNTQFQFIEEISWLTFPGINIVFGVDGLSLFMIILTSFLVPACIMLSQNASVGARAKEFNISFLVLESLLFGVFTTLDIMLFYFLFEAVLIPMYMLLGVCGSRERKIRASYLLFLYTLVSSFFMFVAILQLYFTFGTTDYELLKTFHISLNMERFCWLAFFLSFAVKMPLVPFHVWLPEAHAEAPTAGSVILAGVLLKLGGYGFIRFSIGLFPDASAFFTPLIFTISSFGILYASFTTLQQVDLKKIIAYSSVAHMGVVTIGIFSGNSQSILGGIFLMLSHGIVSGALFLCVGFLYERYNTRVVKYYGGLVSTMPLLSTFFILFIMFNIGIPGSSNFVSELLIFFGCYQANSCAALFGAAGLVLSAAYSLWFQNRIFFGNSKISGLRYFKDFSRFELHTAFPFLLCGIFFGLKPAILLSFLGVY
jgi:NADH-quinone oxidoreductase subunit M